MSPYLVHMMILRHRGLGLIVCPEGHSIFETCLWVPVCLQSSHFIDIQQMAQSYADDNAPFFLLNIGKLWRY